MAVLKFEKFMSIFINIYSEFDLQQLVEFFTTCVKFYTFFRDSA